MSNMNKMLIALAVMICAAGCTSYYKVHDPTTGKDYYTTKVDEKKGGASTLTDARTGSRVTVQNSEVTKIKKEEFETGKNTAPVGPSAQTPAAAAAQPAAGMQPAPVPPV